LHVILRLSAAGHISLGSECESPPGDGKPDEQPMKGEIRDSQVRGLLEKTKKQDFGSYLWSVRLERIRGFRGASITFSYPVTALIGPNGAGKTTVLGACACIYDCILPQNVFRKSRVGDEAMDDWYMEYELLEKGLNSKGTLRASVALKRNQWSRTNGFLRRVKQCTLNRTVPPVDNPLFNFRKRLSVFGEQGGRKISFSTEPVSDIEGIKRESERILGRSLEEFKLYKVSLEIERRRSQSPFKTVVDRVEHLDDGTTVVYKRKIPVETSEPNVKKYRQSQLMYVGAYEGTNYSEFNFGSGESSVMRMVADIESLPENSLVLIEEIENGLHPLAVRRMVEYLEDVAERRGIQSVFTTHSDYALAPLPSEAIWACLDGHFQQGKLSVETLRAVSGRVDRRLALFVEDEFAGVWVEAVIREHMGARREEVGIYPTRGDGNAVKTHTSHLANPAVNFRSVCFIDGDSEQKEDEAAWIYRLPGLGPESTVFNTVLRNLDQNVALLTANLQRPLSKQDEVAKAIRDVSHTNRDSHLLFSQVGAKMGFVPEAVVRGAFLSVWIQENPGEARRIAEAVEKVLRLPSKDG
jgi:AAA domain, putative AbiEii toxin, Type IV TA system